MSKIQFKITNKKSKAVHYLNSKEKLDFMQLNGEENYDIVDLTSEKMKRDRKIDEALGLLTLFLAVTALVITFITFY